MSSLGLIIWNISMLNSMILNVQVFGGMLFEGSLTRRRSWRVKKLSRAELRPSGWGEHLHKPSPPGGGEVAISQENDLITFVNSSAASRQAWGGALTSTLRSAVAAFMFTFWLRNRSHFAIWKLCLILLEDRLPILKFSDQKPLNGETIPSSSPSSLSPVCSSKGDDRQRKTFGPELPVILTSLFKIH